MHFNAYQYYNLEVSFEIEAQGTFYWDKNANYIHLIAQLTCATKSIWRYLWELKLVEMGYYLIFVTS